MLARQSLDDIAARQRFKLTLNTSDSVRGTQAIRTCLQTVLSTDTASTSHWRLWYCVWACAAAVEGLATVRLFLNNNID